MKKIWLIRHAESEANIGLPTSDPVEIALTKKGLIQSQLVAHAFTQAPSLLITSPYLRTKDTAQPTIERFHKINQEEWSVHEFTYLAPPQCMNMTSTQREPLRKKFWSRADPFYIDGEGAESFSFFMNRVKGTIENIQGCDQNFVAIFSHCRFIQAFLWILLGEGRAIDSKTMLKFRKFSVSFDVPNASIMEINFITDREIRMSHFIVSHLQSGV